MNINEVKLRGLNLTTIDLIKARMLFIEYSIVQYSIVLYSETLIFDLNRDIYD